MDQLNLANVRQSFGNAVYNWKIHEVAAEKIDRRIDRIKLTNVILATAVLILLALPSLPNPIMSEGFAAWMNVAGAFLSVIEISFLILLLSHGYEEKFHQHKKTAQCFRTIRDKYINLITDIMNDASEQEEVIERRNALLSEFQTICNLAPQTTRQDYETTQSRLKPYVKIGRLRKIWQDTCALFSQEKISVEDFTISNEEIDLFLPEDLKLRRSP